MPRKSSRKAAHNKTELFGKLLMILMFSVLISTAILVWVIDKVLPPRIAQVDYAAIRQEFTLELAQANLSTEEVQKRADAFATRFDASVEDFASQHRLVIMPLAFGRFPGAIDATDAIKEMLP